MTQLFGIILAGGQGSRLQPLSHGNIPKQMRSVNSDKYTLFQRAFLNAAELINDKNIVSAVNTEYASEAKEQLAELEELFARKRPFKMSVEPVSRNTAPAAALAAKFINDNLKGFDKDSPLILIMPADSVFADKEILSSALEKGVKLAENGYAAVFGAKPGAKFQKEALYLRTKKSAALSKIAAGALKISDYDAETEQDDFDDMQNSKLFVNTGIYMFSFDTFMNELKKHSKEIYNLISNSLIKESSFPSISFNDYEKLPDITLEDALISKTKKLALIPVETELHDINTFDELYEMSNKDENGNCVLGSAAAIDCGNSILYSADKFLAAIGVKDMIIASSEDYSLVCSKNNPDNVKKIYKKLKEKKLSETELHKTVYRPWGYYKVLENGAGFLTKCITVNPKAKLSLQKHFHRSEHWIVLEGEAVVIKGDNIVPLMPGESVDIDVEEVHSLQNYGPEQLQILEVQLGDVLDEDDIERLSDIYGRV